jgi:hypothetical protein
MDRKRVYIPCVPFGPGTGLRGAVIEDSDGNPTTVTAGRVEIVERRMCVIADYLGGDGVHHRVRFADGQTVCVRPSAHWQYDPDDVDYIVAA